MADPIAPERYPEGNAGFIGHFSALLAAILSYFHARMQLAGMESKEAALHYMMLIVWAGAALVLLFFGYIFFVIGLVFAIAWLFRDPSKWVWVLLAFGIGHFIVAIFCVLVARAKIFVPMFRDTLSELKKDQLWLTRQTQNVKPS